MCSTKSSHLSSIGSVCRDLIETTLSLGYYDLLPVVGETTFRKFSVPATIRELDAPELKKWLDERREREVYELQIECCEWAKAELSRTKEFSQRDKESATAKIDERIAELRRSMMPVKIARWDQRLGWAQNVYGPEEAADIRARFRKKPKP